MAGPSALKDLVGRFEQNRDAYMSGAYNETQVRREFIDPLFELLGWDIANKQGLPEAYKDVIHEDAVRIGGGLKAPDYGFRVGGTRRFFVEAKKPSVNLRDNSSPAFQLRRYAWSAKLPLSILTDFEEFAVYDCRVIPNKLDRPSAARLKFYSYAEYPDTWDEIAGLFSREAVLSGSLDVFAEAATTKRGSATVDAVFLKEIETWRDALAKDLALRNPDLTPRQLNFAVQMTIDRIIFLRMAEDRGIEDYGRLQALLNGRHVYDRLRDLYRQADEKYNSGLFHFQQEKDRPEQPDQLTPKLVIGDEPLKNILKNLYFPDSPYEFSVLPVEVLGQVYEQFLGKTIDLTPGRGVKIEEKPEVRKAGGVYYTPKYIVDYIVEHTVGKLLEGKTPGKNGTASKLRIVDPACGSGSFLIGAYEFLLDWHRDRYLELGPEKHRKEIYQGSGSQWLLTTAEKKRILLNNIYGVDIDPQAVEVTKLSLLLKVLEGESAQTIGTQLAMFHERALPDLSNNIKCGNSLIGPDFYNNPQMSFLDPEDHYRINVFDWKKAFPSVLNREGEGFDAVIGNPPYISMLQLDKSQHPAIKPYWKQKFISAAGAYDIYILFAELGLNLAKSGGYLSFIVPNKFLAAEYAREFRRWILDNSRFLSLLDFSRRKVWSASVYPVVPVFQKTTSPAQYGLEAFTATATSKENLQELGIVPSAWLSDVPDHIWSFITQPGVEILLKILGSSVALQELAEVFGASTVAEGSEYPQLLINNGSVETDPNCARFVVSGSIFRYSTTWSSEPVQFTHEFYSRPLIRLEPPMPARRVAQARSPKIIICKVALEPRAFADLKGDYVGAYTTYVFTRGLELRYLTAVINSRLMRFFIDLFTMLWQWEAATCDFNLLKSEDYPSAQ